MRGAARDSLAEWGRSMSAADTADPDRKGDPRRWLTFPGERVPNDPAPCSKGSKFGKLGAAGWRIVPDPHFFEQAKPWHYPATGNGNPAFLSWLHAHEYLIMPPNDDPRPAWKVTGRVCAIREAAREAMIMCRADSRRLTPGRQGAAQTPASRLGCPTEEPAMDADQLRSAYRIGEKGVNIPQRHPGK